MQAYIGTKIVRAEPMDECTFLEEVEGVGTSNMETRQGYHVIYPDGYESWSPKEVFDAAYRQINEKEATVSAESLPSHLMLFDAREAEESKFDEPKNCSKCIMKDLSDLVNKYGLDNEFGMPDYLVADYIISQLNILGGIWHVGESMSKTPDPEAEPDTTEETNDEQYASEEG